MSLNLTGSNLIPYPYVTTSKTENGITFTDNGDGTITANGTATADAVFKCWAWGDKVLPSGNYFASGCPQNGSVNTYYINCAFRYNNVNFKDVQDRGAGALIEAPNGIEGIYVVIRIKSGITVKNLLFKPMLNKGTTALPYEPYIAPKDVEKVVVAKSPNLLNYANYSNRTIEGIIYTANDDGTITANGTATADSYYYLTQGYSIALKVGTYTVSGCPEGGSRNTYAIVGFGWVPLDIGEGSTFTLEEDANKSIMIFIKKGTTVENLIFFPMLNKGTKVLPYEKYIAPKDVEKVVVAKSPNLIPYPYFTKPSTRNGIDWTINEDNSITANGTATGDSFFWCVSSLYFSKGTYTVSGCPEGGTTNTFWIGAMSLNSVKEYGEGVTTTAEEEGKTNFYCMVKQGVTVENITFYPMLIKNNNPNIFPYPYQNSSMTQGGLTFTDNRDGTITVNGTSTKAMDFYYWNNRSPLKVNAGENYFVDGCPASGGGSKYYQQIFLYNSSGASITSFSDTGNGANITVPENAINLGCKIYINSGQTFDNVIFKPRVIKTEVLPYQKYDREVVWSKTTSDEVADDTTVISDESMEEV